jgi:hypothetical protein
LSGEALGLEGVVLGQKEAAGQVVAPARDDDGAGSEGLGQDPVGVNGIVGVEDEDAEVFEWDACNFLAVAPYDEGAEGDGKAVVPARDFDGSFNHGAPGRRDPKG